MLAANLFTNRANGVVVVVGPVDDSFALIQTLTGEPKRYSMPIREYDGGAFVRMFRPAEDADLTPDLSGFRMPADAPVEWLREEVPASS